MSALPFEVRAAAAVVLLVSIFRAFRGPPAEQPRPVLARQLVFFACALQIATIPAIIAGSSLVAAGLAACGVEAACFALWLGLSDEPPDEGGDDGDGGVPPPEEPGPSFDWDEFDRARVSWERPRVGV